MTKEEINKPENLEQIQGFLEIEEGTFQIHDESYYRIMQNVVVLPVIVNVSYKTNFTSSATIEGTTTNKDIPKSVSIKDQDDTEIGTLFFSDNSRSFEKVDMSADKYIAYLVDTTEERFLLEEYFLTKDYLVIKQEYFEDYKTNYKSSSVLWGGFYHFEDQKTNQPLLQTKEEIKCLPNINLPTDYHIENAQRAIIQPYAFERFLKNYHLLELLFDYQIIQDIANNKNDIRVAGEILRKSYKESDEIHRLKYIIENKITDIDKIVTCLNNVKNYQDLAIEIFYTYGKDSNPLKSKDSFEKILLEITLFSENSFLTKDDGGNIKIPHKKQFIQNEYPDFIHKLTAYWIYRIRSSIAHSKIGEFLLTSSEQEHEKFILEFAEPLLQEVLVQCFKS